MVMDTKVVIILHSPVTGCSVYLRVSELKVGRQESFSWDTREATPRVLRSRPKDNKSGDSLYQATNLYWP